MKIITIITLTIIMLATASPALAADAKENEYTKWCVDSVNKRPKEATTKESITIENCQCLGPQVKNSMSETKYNAVISAFQKGDKTQLGKLNSDKEIEMGFFKAMVACRVYR